MNSTLRTRGMPPFHGGSRASRLSIWLLTLALAAAYSDDDDAGVRTFFGRLSEGDETVGVEVVQDTAQVYVCDGNSTGEFFQGIPVDDRLALTSARGAELDAVIGPDSVTGTFREFPADPLRSFTALPGSRVGVYEVTISADGVARGNSFGGGELEITFADDNTATGHVRYPSGETETRTDTYQQFFEGDPLIGFDPDSAGPARFTATDGLIVGGTSKPGVRHFWNISPD
ncbi:MAG: hypothetical protein ACREQQ_17075 [Candidatus Binatia bacterium]